MSMGIVELVSFMLFCIFGIAYVGKLVILEKRNNIRADVFGKGTKSKETLIIERLLKVITFIGVGIWIINSLMPELVTTGLYRLSRNPAFVGMDLMFIGTAITYGNLLTILAALLVVVGLHLQILQEEKHMRETFGAEYSIYANMTARYIIF